MVIMMTKNSSNPYMYHLKLSRNQLAKLKRISNRLWEMSSEWEGLDGGMVHDLEELADKVESFCSDIKELQEEWHGYNE